MDQMGVSFVGAMTSSMTSLMARASATLNTARKIMVTTNPRPSALCGFQN